MTGKYDCDDMSKRSLSIKTYHIIAIHAITNIHDMVSEVDSTVRYQTFYATVAYMHTSIPPKFEGTNKKHITRVLRTSTFLETTGSTTL
jgi:hypothetical protein